MTPTQTLHRNIQTALLVGSCAIALLYGVLYFGEFLGPGELLGTSPMNLMVTGLHIVYFFLMRWYIARKSLNAATSIDLLLFSLNIAILLLATGGFASPYFVFWLLIILISAMLGKYVVSGYILVTTFYLLVASIFSNVGADFITNNIVYAAASIASGALGMWLWYNHPVKTQQTNSRASELEEKLEIEQLKSEILLRSIGDGVIVTDLAGTIQLFNEPAAKITGWPEGDASGIGYKQVMPLEDEEGNELTGEQDPFHDAITSKKSQKRKDVLILNREKKKLHLSLTVAPIFASANKVVGTIAIFSDISQEKMAARQRDEFISTASHEMRTPVAAIEGFLALAKNPKVSTVDENAKKYIDKAYASTQHLGNLFKDLLSVTKLEDGRLGNNPVRFELGKIIKESIDELQFKAEKKNLGLNLKSHGDLDTNKKGIMPLFYVNADPERIREVFTNLVDNAIKFTPKGTITITMDGNDKEVTVGVHDQGVGIPKDEIDHLFQKFYRIDNSETREIGGTGLGLYLSRTIIEMYNGRIWVESEEGKGSDFYFSLPRT